MRRKKLLGIFLLVILALSSPTMSIAQAVTVDDVEHLGDYRLKLKFETTASKETIWKLWSDVENWKQYDQIIIYSRLDKGQNFETGATGVVKTTSAPKSKFKLTEVTQGVSFTERLTTPLWQSIDLLRYFEKSENGNTVVVHEVHFKGALRWLIYAVAGKPFKKELPRVMNKLKEIAEAQSAPAENIE